MKHELTTLAAVAITAIAGNAFASPNPPVEAGKPSIADVTAIATPSVVNISARRTSNVASPLRWDPFFHHRPGDRRSQRYANSRGSGVIVSARGHILTNNHVVARAERIHVTLPDGREIAATVIGADPKSDLAVLKLDGNPRGLQPVKIGRSSELRLGDIVLAIGNPFGVGQSVTMGIVSAKGRANVNLVDYEDFIQTDAAINPGNSGGALINMKGELVGINTAILSRSGGYQGIGFAIPTDMAGPIMRSLIKNGRVVRGWLGVSIANVDAETAQRLGTRANNGVRVAKVVPASPAAKAGLKTDDVIVSINGKPTRSTGQLRNRIASAGANTSVELELIRGGQRQTMRVQLRALQSQTANQQTLTPLGVHVSPITPALRRQFRIPSDIKTGLVVQDSGTQNGLSHMLRRGDIILQLNGKRVRTTKQFNQAFARQARQLSMRLYRNGSIIEFSIQK